MRVLLASDFYRPFVGGAELQVELLAAALAARGHGVDVATVWHEGLQRSETDGQVAIHRLTSQLLEMPRFYSGATRHFHPPFPVPGVVRGLRGLIAQARPSVVHANGWIAYSCAAALAGSNIPLVLSVRDYGYSCAVRTLMHNDREICSGPALGKCTACSARQYGIAKGAAAVAGVLGGRTLLRRRTAAIHAVSQFVRSIVLRDFVGASASAPPVEVIADIPPTATTKEASGGFDVEELPSGPFVLFVGQLSRHKGIMWLLNAYAELDDPPPLVMIGTRWPDTPVSFPDGVTVIENAPHAVVMKAWERSLFGVAPSLWPDPLPGVVREAMSRGRPVVGSAVGGIVDMIDDGMNGLLVTPGDVKGLSHAMDRLIHDTMLRDQLGKAALESIAPYSSEAIARQFERLYDIAGAAP